MLYIGHFSFAYESKERRKPAQPWHGYFTAVVEAKGPDDALKHLTQAGSDELRHGFSPSVGSAFRMPWA